MVLCVQASAREKARNSVLNIKLYKFGIYISQRIGEAVEHVKYMLS